MSALKQITTKAKALYKSGKYKKWTDAIKAASKTVVKKVSGTTKKKAAPKKKAISTHKDTKSHNVNIRVVSGDKPKGTIISKLTALKLASEYHTGQWSALYSFASSQTYYDKFFNDYLVEINSDLKSAEKRNNKKWIKELTALKRWFEYKHWEHNKSVGAVKIIQKGEAKNARVTKVLQQVRTKKGTFKGYKKISGMKITGMPNYSDPDMARELELWATNDSGLYYQQRRPILINLSKKYKKGTFDVDKAAKLWRYFVDNSLQKYNKEFGSRGDKWHELMSVHDRNLLAHEMAVDTKNEFDLGNFTEK